MPAYPWYCNCINTLYNNRSIIFCINRGKTGAVTYRHGTSLTTWSQFLGLPFADSMSAFPSAHGRDQDSGLGVIHQSSFIWTQTCGEVRTRSSREFFALRGNNSPGSRGTSSPGRECKSESEKCQGEASLAECRRWSRASTTCSATAWWSWRWWSTVTRRPRATWRSPRVPCSASTSRAVSRSPTAFPSPRTTTSSTRRITSWAWCAGYECEFPLGSRLHQTCLLGSFHFQNCAFSCL